MTNSGNSKQGAVKPLRVVVVGGGLVGTVAASMMAKRGHDVYVYELRDDIRKLEHVPGRSINLALSLRGIEALKRLGVAEELLKNHAIPMYARMIHGVDSTKRAIPYGKKNECINSVSRRTLNEVLLTDAEKFPNVTVRFNQKMTGGKLEEGEASFLNTITGEVINEKADLIIGCDGAYSMVRRMMMRKPLFDFSQEYIEHGYLELYIPPSEEAEEQMELNYLHIWPRKRYMMIALPNLDRSWTVTLFMPLETFDELNSPEKLMEFFQENFPDALPLIGEKGLVQSFFRTKPSHLLCVKCKPYHVGNKTVILGDAAHAMVPFYGQGMNCGLEDCVIFDDFMTKFNEDLSQVLPAYSEFRHPDAVAICDLALYNYIEMRDLVNSTTFLLRKKLDNFLNYLMPNTWVPLYTTVTFSRKRYHQCIQNKKWQDKILKRLVLALGMSTMALASLPLIINPSSWNALVSGA